MEEFSPKIKTFITQYKTDSEPLQVFKTKIGKVLTGEQLPGTTGYATTATEDIPSKVFKNKENFQSLIEAVGGNKEFAQTQAQRYFSGELEKLGSDPKAIEKFIRSNRDMLKETNSMSMVENYLKEVRTAVSRGTKATEIVEKSTKTAEQQRAIQADYAKLQSQIQTANTPLEVSNYYKQFANKLLSEGKATQAEYREMINEANRVSTAEEIQMQQNVI
jgi:hypothetical protein